MRRLQRKTPRKPISDINVVPYIDVMLVLLVIFMVTAPLLHQGVSVELPQAQAQALAQQDAEPLVASVDLEGRYFLNVGEDPSAPVADKFMLARVAAVLRNRPETPVYVRGDRGVDYGSVIRLMALLQAAGAAKVGLMTDPLPSTDG